MRTHRIGAHGLEGAGADVQRDEGTMHAARVERREQRVSR
jgi:hypothetical protein